MVGGCKYNFWPGTLHSLVRELIIFYKFCFVYKLQVLLLPQYRGCCHPCLSVSHLVEMYCKIVDRVCRIHGLPWIDMSDIVDVMWDRGSAWSHYDDVSSDMETMCIIRIVFPWNKLGISIRFSEQWSGVFVV